MGETARNERDEEGRVDVRRGRTGEVRAIIGLARKSERGPMVVIGFCTNPRAQVTWIVTVGLPGVCHVHPRPPGQPRTAPPGRGGRVHIAAWVRSSGWAYLSHRPSEHLDLADDNLRRNLPSRRPDAGHIPCSIGCRSHLPLPHES